jgi:rubrerythrin
MPERIHKLSLLDNSHSFLKEAVKKAVAARKDVSQWKFAILNLVQAVELSLKELLRRKHPVLIYENIDTPRNTVSISQALARIENDKILGIIIPENEKKKIAEAVKLRNEITHYEFELTEEYAMAKFSEIFAFIVYFQGLHLEIEIDDVLDYDLLQEIVNIEKCFKELLEKALRRIADENIPDESIWQCPCCGEYTFVIEDVKNVCYLCRESQEVVECPQCGELHFDYDLIDFSDLIDTDYSEGEVIVLNNYGYSKFNACPDCIDKIRTDIKSQREEEEYNNYL